MKREIKKFFLLVSVILFLLHGFLFFKATFAFSEGALLDDPTLSLDVLETSEKEANKKDRKIERKLSQEENSYEVNAQISDLGVSYLISVTNYRQEKTYWCGPASVRQSLSFHKVKSGSSASLPSQSTIASLAGTTSSGSTTTGLKSAINYYASVFKFENDKYVVGNLIGLENPKGTFESRIKGDLSLKTNAPIILVRTDKLDYYNGHRTRHYVTLSGYARDPNGNKSLRIVDPHYNDSYFGIHWEPFDNVYSAVYWADYEGSNYVMLY